MARLRDISPVLRSVGPWTLFKRIIQQVAEDNVTTLGAAMAYSWLFAVFPFLVFLLSLVPLLPNEFKPNVQADVKEFVDAAMPPDVASFVNEKVDDVLKKPSAGGFLSFGLLLTVWAASKGMAMTMAAIDKAYDVEKGRPFYKQQPLALILTLIVATLVIVVMILLPIGSGLLHWLIKQQQILPSLYVIVNVARYAIALLLMFVVLAIIYHFGPSFKQPFVAVTPGAVFCITVWLLLGALFKIYMTNLGGAYNYTKTYGAVAGAAILLLFFYIDAVVLLVGAEINSEIDFAMTGIRGGPAAAVGAPSAPAVPGNPDSVKPLQ